MQDTRKRTHSNSAAYNDETSDCTADPALIMGPRHLLDAWSDGEDARAGIEKGVEKQGQDGKKYKRAEASAVGAD